LFEATDAVTLMVKKLTPIASKNMTAFSKVADKCRIGKTVPVEDQCFAGVTACVDYCTHPHCDTSNMPGGLTAVSFQFLLTFL
jgi:methylcytosine dioxygenase